MVTIQQALQHCKTRIVTGNGGTHANYDRVTRFAKLYEQLVTGEDHADLLERYFYKESKEELTKIGKITEPITSSVCNALIAAFKKVLRTQPIVRKIDFKDGLADKKPIIEKALENYYSGSNLDYYIEKRFHDLSFIDPNAFIVTDYMIPLTPDGQQDLTEKPNPYPFEVSSYDAINFGLENGVLQFLLAQDGNRLINYLTDHAVVFVELPRTETEEGTEGGRFIDGEVTIQIRTASGAFVEKRETLPIKFLFKDRAFDIEYFTHKQGRVPAERVGYVFDKKTKGQTFVNPFHYGALPFLMKSIKSVAELDLTMHSHAFPQKVHYVEGCSFDANQVCSTSKMRADQCTLCNKKGYTSHNSSKDIIDFKLPRNNDDLLDLSKLMHIFYPPIEGIKFQDEYIDKLVAKCYKAVFNSEVFSKDQVQKTATGTNLDIQNAYDPMSDYANKKSDFWKKTVLMVAVILDYNDCIAEEKYPKDFKMKSVTDLLNDLRTANESSAPSFIITEINRDIANQLYLDRPQEMLKYEVKQRLAPFSGKTPTETALLLAQDNVLRRDKILFNYYEQFLEELEEDSLKANTGFDELLGEQAQLKAQLEVAKKAELVWFYDLPFNIQKALLRAKADNMMLAIEEETPAAVSFTEGGG
jgi:hypothetical protein